MRWFVVLFYGSYVAMHLYFWYRAWRAFPKLRLAHVPIGLFLLVMVLAPVLFRAFDREEWTTAQRWLAFVGFTWIAPIFWFCILGGLVETWNLVVHGVGVWSPWVRRWRVPARAQFVASIAVVVVLSMWSLVEAARPKVLEYHISVPQWPARAPPVRILHLSDLHLSSGRGWGILKRVGEAVETWKPNVVVVTGDLLDTPPEHVPDMVAYLAGLHAPLGKFSVLGNHEFYTGVDESLRFNRAAGFRVLRGESVSVSPYLRIAGVDDPSGTFMGFRCHNDEAKAMPPCPATQVYVLLKHQPTVSPSRVGRYILQLSGHTHGGQIFPFHLVLWEMYPFGPGLHDLGRGSKLYLSRGAGTWGPAMRLAAPPEITLFELGPVK